MDSAFWILILLALFMILIGVIFTVIIRKNRKRCSYKVIGVISGSREATSYSHDSDIHGYRTYHHGDYEYQYQGNSYYAISTIGTTARPKQGKKTTIYINPDNPEDYAIDTRLYTLLASIFYAIGAILFIIAIVVTSV